jgi:hypothetical protein
VKRSDAALRRLRRIAQNGYAAGMLAWHVLPFLLVPSRHIISEGQTENLQFAPIAAAKKAVFCRCSSKNPAALAIPASACYDTQVLTS